MQRFAAVLREEWPRLLIELIVLVAGITISFALDGWRTGLEHRATERRSLMAVRDNLVTDSANLALQSARVARMLHA